jgi:hypothetical protein
MIARLRETEFNHLGQHSITLPPPPSLLGSAPPAQPSACA